jgi:peptide chain release factor 2
MRIEERLEVLDNQAQHVSFLVTCREPRDLGDALLTLTLVNEQGEGLDAVAKLARMYQGLARRHGLDVEVLSDCQGGQPNQDAIVMHVSGAGAFALLTGESGLHQISRVRGENRGNKRRTVDRDVVRVDVLPAPGGENPLARDDVRIETRPLSDAKGRLIGKPKHEVQLLHVPTMISVRAWTDGTKAQAGERVMVLLRAQVEAAGKIQQAPAASPLLVRRYSLGPAPLVRDLRSGRSTGRLDQVLDGHLEAFLQHPSSS